MKDDKPVYASHVDGTVAALQSRLVIKLVAQQPVGRCIDMLATRFGLESHQPLVCAQPQLSVVVFHHPIHDVAGETLRHVITDKVVRLRTETAKAGPLRHEPQPLMAVLKNTDDLVIRQGSGISRHPLILFPVLAGQIIAKNPFGIGGHP